MIFGREKTCQWIEYVDRIFVDGTFSLAPLPDKREPTYRQMIGMLKNCWSQFRPTTISMDFEFGIINAFKHHFPLAGTTGCLFHWVKNVKRHLSDVGLYKRYLQDPTFALNARTIPALPFVRPDLLERTVAALLDALPPELVPIYNYFERTYMDRILRVRLDGSVIRDKPLFDIDLWSVYDRTLDGEAHTNNFVEASHRRLQSEFSCDHRRFIDGLRIIQQSRDADLRGPLS